MIPAEKTKGVVYEVKCKYCQESCVGETLGPMTARLKGHERHTKNGRSDLSAVAEHVTLNNHKMNLRGARFLAVERKWHARKV